ncbi:hypothetical protein SHKM778_37230 [Streptomyces sp. KM77-8]|uniref:Glycosyl hydrolase family 13 catalytic domain-containing protein n=1 Tax=Streptomyces haneummycinicus TaxID=3074435 RepID=A0AAT9HIM1_9ACTN
MTCPWDAARLRTSIEDTLAEHAPIGAPATWVLCNHDITRTVTRYGRADTGFDFAAKAFGTPTDLALGTRRARAAALLSLALPGAVYVYQGEELGLPEADIPLDRIEDPMHARSGGVDPGRDGCRVPLPWTADAPHAGFGGEPWLPQPAGWASYAADRQEGDPGSTLALYREAIRLRPAFGDGPSPGCAPRRRPRLRPRRRPVPGQPGGHARRPPRPHRTPPRERPAGPRRAAAEGHRGLAARLSHPHPLVPVPPPRRDQHMSTSVRSMSVIGTVVAVAAGTLVALAPAPAHAAAGAALPSPPSRPRRPPAPARGSAPTTPRAPSPPRPPAARRYASPRVSAWSSRCPARPTR